MRNGVVNNTESSLSAVAYISGGASCELVHAGLVSLSQQLSGVEDGNFPRPVADTPSNKKIELESSGVSSLERRKINEGS